MQLTLLGTGNAAGVPLYGCECEYCARARKERNLQRTPCSALLETDDKRFLLDAGQVNLCEQFPAGSLDGIFLTHFHPDHVQGLFHMRWGIGKTIPVYTPPDAGGYVDLYKHPGILEFIPQQKFESFCLGEVEIAPVPLLHSKPTFGFVFKQAGECIAYLTDTKGLSPRTASYMTDLQLDLMVIDCSYVPGSEEMGHNNLDDVLAIDAQLRPKRTILTHVGHDLDIWFNNNKGCLPSHIIIGRDGMTVYPIPA
ncbi:MAG: phosphonate metabolism protein PhnP [gamma proteobacterium symbiont of Ctena orbiculata]|nr:MAG: phosphonate metabolism protein PhnP [gamma proteobacterium symbiont of Ctena orbiculata]PVV20633.1 MAG: phosphonate metabolism protein PhnP [gamma proteobacterium symbiont of Ctena orbiculata]